MRPLLFLFWILFACNSSDVQLQKHSRIEDVRADSLAGMRLNNYFMQYEILPTASLDCKPGIDTTVGLAGHKMVWRESEDGTTIGIDEDVFSLRDKVTINDVWDGKDSVDYVNSWDKIKLYKFSGHELICIRMSFSPCTGIGCGVDYFLVYDVGTRSKNFFGTFRSGNDLSLYDFKNDGKVDYIAKTYSGDAHGSTMTEVIYTLYSMESNGEFLLHTSPTKEKYKIVLTSYPSDTLGVKVAMENWIVNPE